MHIHDDNCDAQHCQVCGGCWYHAKSLANCRHTDDLYGKPEIAPERYPKYTGEKKEGKKTGVQAEHLHICYHDSVQDVVRLALNPNRELMQAKGDASYYRPERSQSRGAHWWGEGVVLKKQNAQGLVDEIITPGWTYGVEKIHKNLATLEAPPAQSIRRRSRWFEVGDELDMQRVYNGDLDIAWRQTLPAMGRGPRRIRIITDIAANCDVPGEEMFWRGAATVKLADLLMEAGYLVEMASVEASWANGCNGGRTFESWQGKLKGASIYVVTKTYDTPFNINNVASTAALPAFFREICLLYAWGHFPMSMSEGCGHALHIENAPEGVIPKDEHAHTIIAGHKVNSAERANAWLKEQVHALEVLQGLTD